MKAAITSVFALLLPATALGQSQTGHDQAAPVDESVEHAANVDNPAEPDNVRSWGRKIIEGYPREAIRNEQQGNVTVMATIDKEGRVSDCTVTESSGHAILDDYTCKAVKRLARFKPATDERGRPVQGTWSETIRYMLF